MLYGFLFVIWCYVILGSQVIHLLIQIHTFFSSNEVVRSRSVQDLLMVSFNLSTIPSPASIPCAMPAPKYGCLDNPDVALTVSGSAEGNSDTDPKTIEFAPGNQTVSLQCRDRTSGELVLDLFVIFHLVT